MAAAWPVREGTHDYGWNDEPAHEWGFDNLPGDERAIDDFLTRRMPFGYLADDFDLHHENEYAELGSPSPTIDDIVRGTLDRTPSLNEEGETDDDVIFVQPHSHARPTSSSGMGNEQSSINSARSASHGLNHLPPHNLFTSSSPRLRQTPPPRSARYEDWLEHTTRSSSTLGQAPDDFFNAASERTPRSPVPNIEDSDSDGFEEMPALTRGRRESVVDLTADPSSPQQTMPGRTRSRPPKRRAEQADSAAAAGSSRRPAKRQRPTTSTSASASASRTRTQDEPIEELDLTQSPTSALRAAEQTRAIAAQQASTDQPTGPLRIGQRQCIICMESYTNASVTPCGHIYCHECLDQALKQGEKNSERHVGTCPVCRQEIHRDEKKKRKGGGKPVAIAFMKKSAFRTKGRPAFETAAAGA